VPDTTALRWLRVLEERQIVEREEDPNDHRRMLVHLSVSAFLEMNRYLRHIVDGHSAFVMLTPSGRAKEQPVTL
jgi:hypothetical protein